MGGGGLLAWVGTILTSVGPSRDLRINTTDNR